MTGVGDFETRVMMQSTGGGSYVLYGVLLLSIVTTVKLHSQQLECLPLPPVHLLHQVCTYQKACPVEAMRAVNTFRTKKKIRKIQYKVSNQFNVA